MLYDWGAFTFNIEPMPAPLFGVKAFQSRSGQSNVPCDLKRVPRLTNYYRLMSPNSAENAQVPNLNPTNNCKICVAAIIGAGHNLKSSKTLANITTSAGAIGRTPTPAEICPKYRDHHLPLETTLDICDSQRRANDPASQIETSSLYAPG
ncbi:hypothetical protein BDN71DRAFT_1435288 [Pleurotus eryngii]|uniref:Uncharacterized protein n=1 Tax=Pleurotus eryngii TaxID=5323 RepID=A0A9P5ZPM5_PLEER|nr:hypothetical protein BDN71DRAFT_1435288 [Pleurotus eryngii]